MRGDWDLIPEGRAEWIGYGIALIIVILAALWINRCPPQEGGFFTVTDDTALRNDVRNPLAWLYLSRRPGRFCLSSPPPDTKHNCKQNY